MSPLLTEEATGFDSSTPANQIAQVATRQREGLHTQKFPYAFAVNGGTIADSPYQSTDLKDQIPVGAIVTRAWMEVTETFTSSSNAATVAISLVGANDIRSAIAISDGSNPWAAGFQDGIQSVAAANFLKVTADSLIKVTVAVENLTAGAMDIHLEYTLPA